MVTEDEEFKKVNFDKFSKLPTVFQVLRHHFNSANKLLKTTSFEEIWFSLLLTPSGRFLKTAGGWLDRALT